MKQTPDDRGADEFYIGYLPMAPRGIARRTGAAVIVCAVLGVGAALALSAAFRAPGAAVWEAEARDFSGQLVEHPYPMLRISDGQAGEGVRRALLVATGKRGVSDRVRGKDGDLVTIRGTALRRDGRLIIEVSDEDGAIRALDSADRHLPEPAIRELGRQTIEGEIIDPKCFFGAMKPGDGTLHKGCAIRCIDGGIPPVLAARNREGQFTYYLIEKGTQAAPGTDTDRGRDSLPGRGAGAPANRRVLPFVGEIVAVTGQVYELDGLLVIRLDETPGAIARR